MPSARLEMTEAEREAKSLIPKRLFKFTLNSDILKSELEEEEYDWYEELIKKDRNFRKKIYEILNFMDGKRSVYDISRTVSAEYGETNLEDLLRFTRNLEKVKLISFQ